MEEHKDLSNLIDRYLNDELSPIEKKSFESELKSNSELKQQFEWHVQVKLASIKLGEQELKNKLNNMHQEFFEVSENSQSFIKRRIIPYIAVAASVILIIGFGVIRYLQHDSVEKLYSEYYSKPNISLVQRSSQTDSVLKLAQSAYVEEDFKQASTLFSTYLSEHENPFVSLFLGICYLELEQNKKANMEFKQAAKNSIIQDEANWYLALSLLKSGNKKEAQELLSMIANNRDSDFKNQAAELMDELH